MEEKNLIQTQKEEKNPFTLFEESEKAVQGSVFKEKINIKLQAIPPAQQAKDSPNSQSQFLTVTFSGDKTFGELLFKLRSKKNVKSCFEKVNFFYCGNNFSVNPSTQIRDLYYQFSTQDELTIKYAISESWG